MACSKHTEPDSISSSTVTASTTTSTTTSNTTSTTTSTPFSMGNTRRRHSARHSSGDDSSPGCFDGCFGGSGKRRHRTHEARANRPVELQPLPRPTLVYSPTGRHRHRSPPQHTSRSHSRQSESQRVRSQSRHRSSATPGHSSTESGLRGSPAHQLSPRESGSRHRVSPAQHSSSGNSGSGNLSSGGYRRSARSSGHNTPLRASPRESQYSHSSRAPSRHSSPDRPLAPGRGDRLPSNASSYSYGEIQQVGAKWQRWLDDENASGCKYRRLVLEGPWINDDTEPNEYTHATGPGVILAQDIARYDGPHWNDVALGQYAMDFSIDSLRHVYFCDVINRNVVDFVVGVLYRNILPVPWRDWNPTADTQRFWEYGTPEYQGILGTTFGKGVCALLISAFPRGDYMIARIATWKDGALHMRFDIETTEHLYPGRGDALF
ncbi:unnamed protein product [Penicillium bialowiezense]